MKNYSERYGKIQVFFVILHYMNLDITEKCVKALLELDDIESCQIVIVDNASANGSGILLQQIFSGNGNIKVLFNENNGGFSEGNNIGYEYAKEMGAAYVVCMNNDIIIKQKNFIHLLLSCEPDSQIIGPDIVTSDGIHQNPFRNGRMSDKRMRFLIAYNFAVSLIYSNKVTGGIFYKVISRRKKKKNNAPEGGDCENCVLHGACVIFLPEWVRTEKFAFVPGIYMYGEEDLLAEYAHIKAYKLRYHPELKVQHMESLSTKMKYKTDVDRRGFKARNMFHSFVYIYRFRRGERNKI